MFITTILAAINQRLKARRTLQQLMELDDRGLADIGLNRGMLLGIARMPDNR